MRDVAERSGFAISTVSRVLSGTKFVAPETEAAVRQAMEDLSFHRDSHARRLARGSSDLLGLVISDIENPFYPGLIKAFETAAVDRGFEVMLCATNYDASRTDQVFRRLLENKAPGVAVMTSRIRPAYGNLLAERGIASVALDGAAPGVLRSTLRIDYAQGAAEAVAYLHTLGHRRFAMIAGPQSRASHVAYRKAVQRAVTRFGAHLEVVEANNDVATGEAAAARLLGNKPLPTAVLCSNDLTAMAAIRSFLRSGLRVPGDISVLGADDIPMANLTQPPLSSICIPREELGRAAVDLLVALLQSPNKPGQKRMITTRLVVRESTGTPPERR